MLMSLMTGFGLASGAGGRASLVALLLGIFHYTEYFELSQQFEWVASPPVMGVLAVIAIVEMWADAHPELSEFSEYPTYLMSFAVGFISLSAATGAVDNNLIQLAGSGILGGGTALGVRYVRSEVSEFISDIGEGVDGTVGDGTTNKIRSWFENGATVSVASIAVLMPVLAVIAIVLFLLIGGFLLFSRRSKSETSQETQDQSTTIENSNDVVENQEQN